MRLPYTALACAAVAASLLVRSLSSTAQGCTDDHKTIDTFVGVILEIVPAPDPFDFAEIRLQAAANCSPLWMPVRKSDAVQCRIGDRVVARGIVVSDPENNAWNLNPERNPYMLIGQDYSCTR